MKESEALKEYLIDTETKLIESKLNSSDILQPTSTDVDLEVASTKEDCFEKNNNKNKKKNKKKRINR